MTRVVMPPEDTASALCNSTSWLARASDTGRYVLRDVADLEPDHQRRILGWCRAHADQLHWMARKEIDRRFKHGEIGFAHRAELMRPLRCDPAVWLEDTALIRRLVQLVPTPPPSPRRRRYLPARLTGGR